MKRTRIITPAIFLVITISLFTSCKKKELTYYSTHVFWFDKNTKDSLVKYGNHYLTVNYDYIPSNGESGFGVTVDTSTFRSTMPECDAKNLLFLKLKLKKGEKKTIRYQIYRVEKTQSGFVSSNAINRNWEGEITIHVNDCSQTQLIW